MLAGGGNADALVRMSYMEIYNEQVMDLLDYETKKDLTIYDHPVRGAYVKNVREEVVSNPDQVMALLEQGETGRHYGATKVCSYYTYVQSICSVYIFSVYVQCKRFAPTLTFYLPLRTQIKSYTTRGGL